MHRLYALDMGSLCAWHYFANPEGDIGMLVALEGWIDEFRDRFNPTHVVACFDAGNNFRNKIDPEYKLNRKTKPKPENFIAQLQKAPEVIEKAGIKSLRIDTLEADDLLAYVVARFADEETEVIVISEDKDLSCLVGEHCRQFTPRDGHFFDVAKITDKMGFPPWRMTDFLAMVGDSSDNIKGIKGIGEVTAKYVIQNTRSMAEAFRKAAAGEFKDLKPATQKRLAEGREEYEHALKLVSLRFDLVPSEALTLDGCRIAARQVAA